MTDRIKIIHEECRLRGLSGMPTHFMVDLHGSALGRFKELPHYEKLARYMAYAIENQPVFAYENDGIGGRVYYNNDAKLDALLNFNGEHTETGTLEKAIGLLRVAEYLRIP